MSWLSRVELHVKLFDRARTVSIAIVLLLLISPLAWGKDNIVITLKADPTDAPEGLEAACVALQLGTGLLLQSPRNEVTIFATLDGIYIADAETYGWRFDGDVWVQDESPICDTLGGNPPKLGEATLDTVLENFLRAGGEVLLCPLCDVVRQPYTPITDFLDADLKSLIYRASPFNLLMEAKKIIDY